MLFKSKYPDFFFGRKQKDFDFPILGVGQYYTL